MANFSNVRSRCQNERTTLNIGFLLLNGKMKRKTTNAYPIPNDPIIENLMQFQHFNLFRLNWCCYNAIEQINKTIFSLSCQWTTIIVTADCLAVETLNILPIHWNTCVFCPIYMYLCTANIWFSYFNDILKLMRYPFFFFFFFLFSFLWNIRVTEVTGAAEVRIDSIHT